jgi:hypothetical protein
MQELHIDGETVYVYHEKEMTKADALCMKPGVCVLGTTIENTIENMSQMNEEKKEDSFDFILSCELHNPMATCTVHRGVFL